MLLLSLMFYVNNGSFLEAVYTDEYKIRLILSFAVVTLLTSLYEHSSIKSFAQMRLLTKKLIDVAKEEQLTELASKRGIYEEMELLFDYAKEHNQTLIVMICDIDYLHDIHGRYGDTVGEMVIKEISQEIQNSIKNSDTVARWSGEEFIILFPQMELLDVHKYSTALEKRIKNLKIMHDRKPIQVSLTTGTSDIENVKSVYTAIRQADNKMYKA
jgi:diguanylate cyclase (GGDEF)-like protein